MNRITSSHNPHVMHVRELLVKRSARDKDNTFVVEGVRLVEEAAASGWKPSLALFSEKLSERGKALAPTLEAAGAEVFEVPESLIYAVTGVETSQGVVAVFKKRELALPAKADFLVIADQVRDPGNLGTLLRSAAAAGAQGALLTPTTADPFQPKVMRAGMGAHFRLPVMEVSWAQVEQICHAPGAKLNIWLADAGEGTSCWKADLRSPLALVIGGEAEGVSDEARRAADASVMIPMPGQSESLNAGAAASVLLFEVVRQRLA
jgi:TrmH family RNA methyltransferase